MGFAVRMFLAVLLALATLIAYVPLRMWWSRTTWHEAVALEVETPTGIKAGRAVISLTFYDVLGGEGWRGGSEMRGEATVVEVAPGQFLFALLHSEYLSQKVFPELSSDTGRFISNLANARMKREIPSRAVNPYARNPSYDPRPLLVRFRDINDPRTVEKVNPDNLAASFGPGFKLKSYTLELLGKDEPVTRGKVEKVLGWIGPHPEPSLCQGRGETENIPFCSTVSHGNFVRR